MTPAESILEERWTTRECPDGHFQVVNEQDVEVADTYSEEVTNLLAAAPNLHGAAEATLMFHAGGEWDGAKSDRWRRLTGRSEATTKALCDFIRECMAKARGES